MDFGKRNVIRSAHYSDEASEVDKRKLRFNPRKSDRTTGLRYKRIGF